MGLQSIIYKPTSDWKSTTLQKLHLLMFPTNSKRFLGLWADWLRCNILTSSHSHGSKMSVKWQPGRNRQEYWLASGNNGQQLSRSACGAKVSCFWKRWVRYNQIYKVLDFPSLGHGRSRMAPETSPCRGLMYRRVNAWFASIKTLLNAPNKSKQNSCRVLCPRAT